MNEKPSSETKWKGFLLYFRFLFSLKTLKCPLMLHSFPIGT